jgi:hypothetical protein
MNQEQKKELSRLLVASLDESITREEFEKVDRLLATDNEAADFYIHFMRIYSRFAKPGKLFAENQRRADRHLMFDSQLWKDLAMDEKNAPAVAAEASDEMPLIRKVQRQKIVRQFNRTSLVSMILSAAAMLFIVLFARFSPEHTGIEVAVLSDSLDAQWSDVNSHMIHGMRLTTSYTPLMLKRGMAELTFDTGATLVIEAPAEFELVSNDRIRLNYGKLYAVVPSEAVGFTVDTKNARIIDLGTEFAVKADLDAATELHMIKGQTNLLAGDKRLTSTQVSQGDARLITGTQGDVFEIPCRQEEFVRTIDSGRQLVWRGQSLDAAHLVAGGNGLAEQPYFRCIDSRSGNYLPVPPPDYTFNPRPVPNTFLSVSSSGVIDGIAVPSGRTLISSEGDSFEFMKTSGCLSMDVLAFNNNPVITHKQYKPPVFNGGHVCGDSDSPAVMMHANVLLTFDLRKVRDIVPQGTIKQFRTKGGITEAVADKPDKAKATIQILIDGRVRYERNDVTAADGLLTIEIPIDPQDRFLTIAVTEGHEDPKAWYGPWCNDFFYLVHPEFGFSE